ncbi:unnamed protein product [Didymodactylos carnosus]|uniref:Uncharacterized protein n=1 Tax=Didymodactylos carnosus TaxID=1234261 RepID=A0A8S2E1N0_9BILA|nr:unnamed protein product [Didymodactylos carnosus]CAF3875215.1 unnamed protein product [Didymodactylos carnosus]
MFSFPLSLFVFYPSERTEGEKEYPSIAVSSTAVILREVGLCSKFRTGYPGIEWLRLFLKRWSNELKQRSSALLEKSRAVALTEDRVNVWFKNYGDVLEKLDTRDRPSQVFNMDETGFLDNPDKKRVIVRNSKRHPPFILRNKIQQYYFV